MRFGEPLRSYWPEMLLFVALALPWLSLLVLGMVWLWQGGHVWVWAIAAAVLGLLAWPLSRSVKRRANEKARLELGETVEPSRGGNVVERDAWVEVNRIADATATAPFSFTDMEPLVTSAHQTVEAVARHFHPRESTPWAQFTLPEVLLLAEQVSRDLRRESLGLIPGVRALRLSHLLWVHRQIERYGVFAQAGWHVWRIVRAVVNPLQAAGQEINAKTNTKTARVLYDRLRAHLTKLFVIEVGRAAIDLYSGRLVLSNDELRAARGTDMAGTAAPVVPVRIVLMGQVNAGKSSLLNAMAREVRSAVGPLPTTAGAVEHLLGVEGHPTVMLVDMPGIGERAEAAPELLAQAQRADLVMWVASATQPAREPDRKGLNDVRAWANTQLLRRVPPVLVALTHVDELRPAAEWSPPYDVSAPTTPKAWIIRAALDAAARALDFPTDAIVPVAMPPGREPYNLDALWARIAIELDEAKLVQLDRLRVGHQGISLRELANQLGQAGRVIIKGIA
jgi:predicted GTPase